MKVQQQNTNDNLPSLPVARLVGHDGPVQALFFTAEGKYCLTAGHDRTVRLWNPARMDPAYPSTKSSAPLCTDIPVAILPRALPVQTYTDGHTHPVSAIAVDENSTTLVSASDKTVIVTDLLTQKVQRRFQGHAGVVNAVALSNGCETYLSGSFDGTVRIWDGRSRSYEPIQIMKEAKDSVTDILVDQPDNEALVRTSSVDGVLRTYDLRKGQLSCDDTQSPIVSMALTHDKQCLAISCLDGTIRLMEPSSGEVLNTYEGAHKCSQYAVRCCMTANDVHVVTGSEDGRAVLYDLVTGKSAQTLFGHQKPTCSVAAHPKTENTSVIITASYDGNAVVWSNDDCYIRWQD